jgi:TP901 family phage tail tape measure protein
VSDDNVQVKFGAETSKAEGGINTIKQRLGELSEVATKAFEANQIIEFGEKLAELGRKALEFAEHFSKMGEDLERTTQILGMSAKEFQEFAFAMKVAGVDTESAVQSMIRFEKNIGEAGRGAGEAAPFFKAIGVSMQDLQRGNVQEIMNKVADSFKNTADGVEKTTIALTIGGRSFAQMIPTLNQGSEGLAMWNEKLKETGDRLTELQKGTFAATDDKLDLMKASFEGLGITMFDAFRPAIDSLIEGLTGLVQGFNDAIKDGGNFRAVLQAIVLVVDVVIVAIDSLIQVIRTLWTVTTTAVRIMIEYWMTLAEVMGKVLAGDWDQIGATYSKGLERIKKQTKEAADDIAGYWKGLANRAGNMRDGLSNMGTEGPEAGKDGRPKPKLPGDPNAAKEAAQERLKIATEEVSMQQKLRELDLDNQKAALNHAVEMGQVSEEQKFQYLLQYANQAAQIKAQAIQQELQQDNLKASQKAKLYSQLIILERQHQNQVAQIQRQQQQAQMQRYQQVFRTISSSFQGMIQGILQGTQTWREAMANLFTNLMSSFVGMLVDMLMKWVENQIMMAVFGKTASMAIISGHAAEGGAAAYASTAAIPIVGPALAPAAAAQAYAAIMAFNAMPSYDVGIDNIPFDQVAKVHKGERVMTAGENETFTKAIRGMTGTNENGSTSSSGGGDTHLHFHGAVMDGKQWFMSNKDNIAAALHSASRGGNRKLAAIMK